MPIRRNTKSLYVCVCHLTLAHRWAGLSANFCSSEWSHCHRQPVGAWTSENWPQAMFFICIRNSLHTVFETWRQQLGKKSPGESQGDPPKIVAAPLRSYHLRSSSQITPDLLWVFVFWDPCSSACTLPTFWLVSWGCAASCEEKWNLQKWWDTAVEGCDSVGTGHVRKMKK